LGTQTFSKSKTQYPVGGSPLYIEKGLGSKVWDVDGNEYIDFVNGLGAIILGYNDADVLQAVKRQLEKGTIFSLPSTLEIDVAEKIVEMVPCAQMVRFGKNGSDVTTVAIRLARTYTQREHVAICGYHGWHDWYIGATSKNQGVPKSTQKLTHKFVYNDIASLEMIFQQYKDQVAAVILEPMSSIYPKNDFLKKVKDVTHKNGAVLIFDEMVTGFRFANGGAQELFGVIPDLATFGKGIANGYPLSVIVGSKKIMKLLEDVFFSFTFGGETLSLAAALVVMNKFQKEPVLQYICELGKGVFTALQNLIVKCKVEHVFDVIGHPSWVFLRVKDNGKFSIFDVKTLLMQELMKRGILSLGTHMFTYAHSNEDITCLLRAYEEIFPIIKSAIINESFVSLLSCQVLKPLFQVR
jgi:glutamate-1-semialdehyde 2,1-aminomutase